MRHLLPLLISCLLMLMPFRDAHAAPVSQQSSATSYQAIVITNANLRSGPGTQYSIEGQAQAGQSLVVVACNQDCSWLQLDDGNWIAEFLVDLVGASTGTATPQDSGRTRSSALDDEDVELSEPSEAALEIVAQILSYTGLPQTFEVYSANIYNAAALMANGQRVILYDPQLIADIENITDHDWPAVSILAHEIGHHLAGHTLAEVYNRAYELEADYFSGFILQKMGATLSEAQAVMSLLRDHANMTDHPPQAERLAAIAAGWQEAARQSELAVWEPQLSSFAEEATQKATQKTTQKTIEEVAAKTVIDATSLLAVLQVAYAQGLWAESAEAVVAGREWSLGLRAFAEKH